MTAKRSIRDLERQCKKEPDNLVVRLLLAAAYREAGRTGEAVPLYRSVADSYQRQGRKTQAVAVLKSLLEIDPGDRETRVALDQLDREASGSMPVADISGLPDLPPGATAAPAPVEAEPAARPAGARVLAQDVVVRELTPVRPPGVPSTMRTPLPRLPTPSRGSAPLYTPTPLPAPIPYHEADKTGDHRRAPSEADGDDALTRVADGFMRSRTGATPPPPLRPVTEPEPKRPSTTGEITAPEANLDVAMDLDTRPVRRLSEAELGVLAAPVPGMTGAAPRVDPGDLDGDTNPDAAPHARQATPPIDDEPTRYAGTNPGETEGPTDVRSGARARSKKGGRTSTSVRPAPPRRTRPALDAPTGADPEEPTRVSPPSPTPEIDTSRVPVLPPPIEEPTDVGATRVSEPGMHRSKAFDDSFVGTLDELDPDGASIEAPLELFSMLPEQALAELGRRMLLRSYGAGDLIVHEGEPGDACYVIADGEVRVLKNDPLQPDAGPVEVARLGPRSLFGEFALLADRRRHASVQATTHVDVYEIPRQLLRELAASYREVGPALEAFYRQRLLATLLRTAPFFTPLPEDHRARLLARFVPIRAESGEPIVREGQPAGGLYLIVIGSVEITRRVGKQRSVILATLREGAYFGEMSLLSGDPTSATVVAAGPVELALLPPRDFYEIVSEHPQLWAAIRREARTRALENAKLLAGDSGTV